MPTALRERNRKRLRQIRLDKRRKMYTGRLVNGIVSLSGAPTNRTWVRYPADSAEETLAWGNVLRENVTVWVDKNKAGQNEIVGVEYVEGTQRWGNALETVGAAPVISELQPTSVGEFGILPGRLSASLQGGMYVRVEAFEHEGGRYPTTDIDVSTEYPPTDDAYGRIGLYLDPDTNTVTAFAGEEVFDRSDFTDADKLSVPDGMYPIGAVIVYDSNAISSANTFEDWRLHHSLKTSVGGVVAAEDVTYDNGASGLTATDVQDAIDELEGMVTGGGGAIGDYAIIREKRTLGTYGGTFTAGADQTRALNEELADTGNHFTLASDQITVTTAGTYRFKIAAPAFGVDQHVAWLYNVTTAADVEVGTAGYNEASSTAAHDYSVITGRATFAANDVLEVRHRCQTTKTTDGFGTRHNLHGYEVYTVAEFWKE